MSKQTDLINIPDAITVSGSNVGIGTTSPEVNSKLHVKGASSANLLIEAPTDNASLTLQCGSSDAEAEGAFVQFTQNTTAKWQMGMNTDNSFRWYNYNTSSEAMQINPSGNVGIGVVPSSWWSGMKAVETQASSGGVFASASVNGHFLTNAYYDGSNWKYKNNGAAEYYSQTAGIHQFLNVSSGSAGNNITWSERVRIDSDGLKFNGDTAAANALNDYEEGTWTPTTNAGWTASPIDYARYTKVGEMVHVQTIFGVVGTGNTTHLEVGGLPFITPSAGYATSPVDFGKGGIKGTYVRTESATTTVKFYYPSENTTVNRLQIRGNQIGASYILFGLTYQTNS
jgi:hypothetical protein